MAPDPLHAPERLAAVARSGLLDAGPEASFDRIAGLARDLLDARFALVTVLDGSRSHWRTRTGTGLGELTGTPVEDSFCRHVVEGDSPFVCEDASADERVRDSPLVASLGIASYAGYPVRSPEGHVLGAVCVIDDHPRPWSALDRQVLETLASVASTEVALRIAGEEARAALRAAHAAQRRVQLLAGSGELLRAGLDVDAVLAAITRLVVPALGAGALVYTVDDDGTVAPRLSSVRHVDPDRAERLRAAAAAHPPTLRDAVGPGFVLRTEQPQLVTVDPVRSRASGSGGLAALAELAEDLGVTGLLCVPLSARGRVVGELQVLGSGPEPYTAEDLALATELADRAALALDNAVLHGQQRSAAVALQQSLLTPARALERLGVEVRYRPAAAGDVRVGGDWYDAFAQPDGSTVVIIGDVVGHDLRAAGGMGQLRSMLRVLGYHSDDSPAAVLERVDDAVAGLGVGSLATAVYARLDPPDAGGRRRLRFCNAGHLPPVVLGADGAAAALETPPDVLLGVTRTPARADHDVVLAAGDTLLLCTDGLVERRGRSLDEGIAALTAAVADLSGRPLPELCDGLLARLLPAEHEDDVAVLALRV